jgi:hypothetical protein
MNPQALLFIISFGALTYFWATIWQTLRNRKGLRNTLGLISLALISITLGLIVASAYTTELRQSDIYLFSGIIVYGILYLISFGVWLYFTIRR